MQLDENYDDSWIKSELIFTNQRILWNDGRSKHYKDIKGISFYEGTSSRGLSRILGRLKGGGKIEVFGDGGSHHFEFGDAASFRQAVDLFNQALKE